MAMLIVREYCYLSMRWAHNVRLYCQRGREVRRRATPVRRSHDHYDSAADRRRRFIGQRSPGTCPPAPPPSLPITHMLIDLISHRATPTTIVSALL